MSFKYIYTLQKSLTMDVLQKWDWYGFIVFKKVGTEREWLILSQYYLYDYHLGLESMLVKDTASLSRLVMPVTLDRPHNHTDTDWAPPCMANKGLPKAVGCYRAVKSRCSLRSTWRDLQHLFQNIAVNAKCSFRIETV